MNLGVEGKVALVAASSKGLGYGVARALAADPDLPDDIRGELVATCCRSAVEAACHVAVRRTRLSRGEPHAEVERLIGGAHTTHKIATLAVFDDPARGSDLLGRLRDAGPGAQDAFQNCRKGAHAGLRGDLRPFLRDVERLAAWLQQK